MSFWATKLRGKFGWVLLGKVFLLNRDNDIVFWMSWIVGIMLPPWVNKVHVPRKDAERTYLLTLFEPLRTISTCGSLPAPSIPSWWPSDCSSCKLHKPTPPRGSRKVYLGLSLLKEKKWFPFRSQSQYLVPYWLWLGYVPICEPNTDAKKTKTKHGLTEASQNPSLVR